MNPYTVVNSFGSEPFTGNPVAVFFDSDGWDAVRMQRIAAELKLSESTFLGAPRLGGHANVRIFTPVNELAFAGHPLLGTALAVARRTGLLDLKFETGKGTFRFSINPIRENPFTAYVQMEQPSPIVSSYEHASALLEALGIRQSTLPVDMYDVGPRHVFVGVESIEALASLNPDQRRLAQHLDMAALCFCPDGARGFRLRMFSPAYGVVEDAATGSAAGPLALHLGRYGVVPFGEKIAITQGIEMARPSQMSALVQTDAGQIRLQAGGYGYQAAIGNYLV
ncbi:MAG TPA: PhzF family phenazine biosynthesis protein [Polyangiaceae bacterium]|nr:PhzF family phenazine biosynthesis protein [Polyangiaceae bacterium]